MTTTMLDEMQRTTRASAAREALRQAILDGRLEPGAPLNQAEIARQLGISRAPLREALRELAEEGLVVNIPFRGAFVSTIDRRTLDELCSLRNLIERFAVQRVIERASDADLQRLREIIARMENAADVGDVDAVDREDIAFHTAICELADHHLLLQVWQIYAGQIRRAMVLRNKVNRDPRRIVALHRPILEAILRRDVPAAQAQYAKHGTDLVATLFGEELEEAAATNGVAAREG
jgi:DNA-binding GntR family transcriptional regulator